jgi:hypothetical protein
MADYEGKTVRIPPFDGKNKNFVMWWIRFKAYAKVQKFSQALATTQEADLPVMQKNLTGVLLGIKRQLKLWNVMNKHYFI